MISYYFIVLACLLEVPNLQAESSPGVVIPKCDQTMIKKIETFWGGSGTPKNIIKQIEDSGEYTVVMKTFQFLGRENKCIHIKGSAEKNVFTALSTPVHDNHTTVSIDYHLEEGNGFLLEKKWGFYTYFVLIRNHVLVGYSCLNNGGGNGAINGFIAVANRNFKDSCTQTTIRTARGLMELMGFNFIYQYGEECFD